MAHLVYNGVRYTLDNKTSVPLLKMQIDGALKGTSSCWVKVTVAGGIDIELLYSPGIISILSA